MKGMIVIRLQDGLRVDVQLVEVEYPDRYSAHQAANAIREAVEEWFAEYPKEASEALDYNGGFFNWGDALTEIPDAFWDSKGIRITELGAEEVDHDESLFDEGILSNEEGE